MMFGSKPWPVDPSGDTPLQTACQGPWAFQPWLVQLAGYGAPNGAPDPSDPWGKGIIRLQYLPPGTDAAALVAQQRAALEAALAAGPAGGPGGSAGTASLTLIKEKNWNPFIYHGQLLFSQQFVPHVVIQPYPNGTCVKLFETSSRVFRNLTSKPRGNTQALLIPAAFSGEPRDFYLGVVHAESARSYQNYFYKMQVRVYAESACVTQHAAHWHALSQQTCARTLPDACACLRHNSGGIERA